MVTSENSDLNFTYLETDSVSNDTAMIQETPVLEASVVEAPGQTQPENLEKVLASVEAESFEKPLKNSFGIDMDLLAGLTAEIEATSSPSSLVVDDDESFLASWRGKSNEPSQKVSLLDDINE